MRIGFIFLLKELSGNVRAKKIRMMWKNQSNQMNTFSQLNSMKQLKGAMRAGIHAVLKLDSRSKRPEDELIRWVMLAVELDCNIPFPLQRKVGSNLPYHCLRSNIPCITFHQ